MHSDVLGEGYTATELRIILAKYLGRRVPRSTFSNWKSQIGMSPNELGFYTNEDLEILIALVSWLSRGGKIKPFVKALYEELENASKSQ